MPTFSGKFVRDVRPTANPGIKRLMRKAGYTNGISKEVIEYGIYTVISSIICDIMDKAVIYMEYSKRSTIFPKDITDACKQVLGITYYGNPNGKRTKIHKTESIQTERKKGKVSGMEARYYSKSDDFILQKGPFSRFVIAYTRNEHVHNKNSTMFNKNILFSRRALLILQDIVEDFFIKIIWNAQLIMVHSGRVAIKKGDIVTAHNIMMRHQTIVYRNISV